MSDFQAFLNSINDLDKRTRMERIFTFIKESFPNLKEEIKWNQPMFTDHGTFIIGFSISKGHLAVAPEADGIKAFEQQIEMAGYSHTKELFRIKWIDNIDFDLLHKLIAYNIEDKKEMNNFWRK